MKKLALADDNDLFRKSLIAFLKISKTNEVVLDAKNGKDLLDQLENLKQLPEVVLMDYYMPILDGKQTTKIILKKYPSIKIIGLSMFHHEYVISGMIGSGAKGFLSKNIEAEILERAIQTVLNDKYFIESNNGMFEIFDFSSKSKLGLLSTSLLDITQRQKEFLKLCVSGYSYRDIADKMSISTRTVEKYRDSLFSKLNVNTRVELVMFAIQAGLSDLF